MTPLQLIYDDVFKLPLVRASEVGVQRLLGARFRKLEGLISELDDDLLSRRIKEKLPTIQALGKGLLESIEHVYRGHPHLAYDSFTNAIEAIKLYLERLTQKVRGTEFGHFYRIRGGAADDYSREDLFHIPFEKRHLVKTQRFSIPGLPCLYLGGSLYISWEELGRLPFHELQVSQFWVADDAELNILDLGIWPQVLGLNLKTDASALASVLSGTDVFDSLELAVMCWPLVAACSVKVAQRSAPFIEEYIVPQLLLQWLTQTPNFDGLR